VQGTGGHHADAVIEQARPRLHQPTQFEEIAEVATRFASEAAALNGRQNKFTDTGHLRRVEQAAFEEQSSC
jgi:hypothetical protein